MPGKADSTDKLDATLDQLRARVEEALERSLPAPPAIPQVLRDPMTYSLQAGGKRIRPVLVLLACRACGGEEGDAMPAACAMEMIHTYSLIHDDLPAMDDDDLRRGKPSNHKQFGEASAILAGDALLTHAFSLVAAETPRRDRAATMVAVLADAAGPMGMVAGQALDLDAEGRTITEEELATIHRLKTAALFAASGRLGAEAAGADPELAERLEEYGRQIGLAFQAIDDVLDEEGSAAALGKTPGKDKDVQKATAITTYGLEGARAKALQYSGAALEIARSLEDGAPLVELAERLSTRVS